MTPTLKHGVSIGQVIDFQDARVTIVGAYPSQVRCKIEEIDPSTRLPSGRVRTKTVSRSEYDKWIEDSKPTAPSAQGRRVKVMRVSPSGNPVVAFEDIAFENLKAGDVFFVIEPDGTEVPGGPWLANSSAYRSADAWTVDCDPIKLDTSATEVPLGDPDLAL